MLYLAGDVVYFVDDFSVVAFQQQCGFSVCKSFTFAGFLQDRFYKFDVVTVFFGISHGFANLAVVDKLFSFI